LVIGKLFSPATLGFFTRAGSLNGLIFKYTSGSLNKVFLPVMSQLKHDKIRFLDVFLKTYHMIALLVFLIVGIFICSGELLIITLFGAKWQPSVIIFQVLILRAYGPPLNAIVIQAFLALGKSKANFWHGNVRKILNVASFGVAFAFGFTAYLYCLPFITLLVTAYSTIVVVKLLDTKLRIVIGEALKCVFAFLVALLPWYFLDIDNLWVRTAIGNLTFVLIYIAIVSTIGKENFQRAKNLIFSYVSRFVNRKRKTTSAVEKEVAEQIL
jgi:O-antigen/teichoic acid export membrane protein